MKLPNITKMTVFRFSRFIWVNLSKCSKMSEAHVQPIDSSGEVLNQSESEAIKSVSNQFAFFINLGLSKARDFWIKQDWQGKLLSVRWLTSSPFFWFATIFFVFSNSTLLYSGIFNHSKCNFCSSFLIF